jgi:FKBP-type peptidyl-prolyl cis-trans isomerase
MESSVIPALPSALLVTALVLQAPRGVPQGRPGARPPPPPVPADVEPVTTTASGLQYCVLQAGAAGETPRWGDNVKIRFASWHADGSLIEANLEKATDALVGGVIDGVNEALLLMTPGSRWKLKVPPALGYGEIGARLRVKPDEVVTFELDLDSFTRGPKLPEFPAGDAAKQKKTDSGLVYEPLVEGTGDPPKPDDLLDIKFAVWNEKGRLIDCSELHDDFHFRGRVSDLPLRLLQVAPQLMRTGARYRFEAPPEFCAGLPYGTTYLPRGATAVWELELVSAKPIVLPPLPKLDPEKTHTTKSGLKYEVLEEGSGEPAHLGDKLDVNYVGWTLDGNVFDSSLFSGRPFQIHPLQIGGPRPLIAGWNEGLQLMRLGSKFVFEIPPELAYGPRQMGKIPPNSTLIFQLELVKLER